MFKKVLEKNRRMADSILFLIMADSRKIRVIAGWRFELSRHNAVRVKPKKVRLLDLCSCVYISIFYCLRVSERVLSRTRQIYSFAEVPPDEESNELVMALLSGTQNKLPQHPLG